MQKIRIATANRGAGTAPVFATVEGGYLKDEGLEVELIPHAGHHRSLRALLAGEAEFTNAVAAELIRANVTHGGDAVIIASAISRSAQQVESNLRAADLTLPADVCHVIETIFPLEVAP